MNTPPRGNAVKIAPLTVQQMALLTDALDGKRVATRGGKLSYLESWDVKRMLIRVFGFGGVDARNIDTQVVKIEENIERAGGGKPVAWRVTVMVKAELHIHQLDATFSGSAASTQSGAVLGDVMDFAIKTAESDAIKRCATFLGTQFGLSLYSKGARFDVVEWVVAPTQGWFNGQPTVNMAPTGAVAQQVEVEPTLEELEGQQPPAAGATAPPTQPQQEGLPIGNGITPEQRAANEELVQRGLKMKAEQQAQQAQQ